MQSSSIMKATTESELSKSSRGASLLHDIPEDDEIIAWCDDGRGVLLNEAQRFTDEMLGIYFGGDARRIVRPRQLQRFQERLIRTGVVTNLAAREVLLRDVMANHQSNKDYMYMHATKTTTRDIRSEAAKDDEDTCNGGGAVKGMKRVLSSLSTGLENELETELSPPGSQKKGSSGTSTGIACKDWNCNIKNARAA